MLPYEACNLGSINLAKMVKKSTDISDPKNTYYIDWDRLEEVTKLAVRFLDNVITVSEYLLPEITEKVEKYRKIGLGVMGFHEMLIKLGIPYNSEEAVETAEKVMRYINSVAKQTSNQLALEKKDFSGIQNSMYSENVDDYTHQPMRNATVTTIAPTGSISIIAGTSGGIEPFFDFEYTHTDHDGNERKMEYDFTEQADDEMLVTAKDIEPEYHVKIQAAFQKHVDNAVSKTINLPEDATVEDVKEVYELAYQLGCKGITVYRDGSRDNQVLESDNEDVSRGLGLGQELADEYFKDDGGHLITEENELEDTKNTNEMFDFRHEHSAKPVTDRSDEGKTKVKGGKHGVVMTDDIQNFDEKEMLEALGIDEIDKAILDEMKKEQSNLKVIGEHGSLTPRERPNYTEGSTTRYDTGCGKLYLTVNKDEEGNLLETFIDTGSDGGCRVMTEAVSRLISMSLRAGIAPEEVIDQLRDTSTCPSFMYKKGKCNSLHGRSCPDVVGRALKDELRQMEVTDKEAKAAKDTVKVYYDEEETTSKCPECGSELKFQEGCNLCRECGYSSCS